MTGEMLVAVLFGLTVMTTLSVPSILYWHFRRSDNVTYYFLLMPVPLALGFATSLVAPAVGHISIGTAMATVLGGMGSFATLLVSINADRPVRGGED